MQTRHLIAIALMLVATLAAPVARAITKINIASPATGATEYYTFADSVVTLTRSDEYIITGTTDRNRVVVDSAVTATITLSNVSITSATASPFALSPKGCNVTLRIEGENTLTSTTLNNNALGIYGAGLQVEGAASITISGEGSLVATGGVGGAGIGSGATEGGTAHVTGNIVIKSGTITATGVYAAAGIGGGAYATGGNISIMGGNVIATGGRQGAAIGGGMAGAGGTVSITGGNVTATGGEEAAGIGGGATGDGGTINITGGVVLAISGIQTSGGGGAGIGGGAQAGGGNVSITGGSVYAYGNTGAGVGIGGGYGTTTGNINIGGGTVVANRIGVGGSYSGVLTPTTLTGGAILTDSINNDLSNIGDAQVLRLDSISLDMLQAMAANTPWRTIVYNDSLRDTVIDTLYVRDTIIDTLDAIVHDTLIDSLRDTVIEVFDTIHVRDTLIDSLRDTIIDTLYVRDTIIDTLYVRDTIIDTLRSTHTVIDSALPIDTLYVNDTLVDVHEIENPIYIPINPSADDSTDTGGGTSIAPDAAANPRAITLSDGSLLIQGLTPAQPFTLYTLDGALLVRAIAPDNGACLLRNLPQGPYILLHSARQTKIGR